MFNTSFRKICLLSVLCYSLALEKTTSRVEKFRQSTFAVLKFGHCSFEHLKRKRFELTLQFYTEYLVRMKLKKISNCLTILINLNDRYGFEMYSSYSHWKDGSNAIIAYTKLSF